LDYELCDVGDVAEFEEGDFDSEEHFDDDDKDETSSDPSK
jgi:hypothetical protein